MVDGHPLDLCEPLVGTTGAVVSSRRLVTLGEHPTTSTEGLGSGYLRRTEEWQDQNYPHVRGNRCRSFIKGLPVGVRVRRSGRSLKH